MSDTTSLKTSAALDTLLKMLKKYFDEVSFAGLPAWKNDETKLNEINMNELRNAINTLQNSDTLVSNGTFKMLYQLLDEVVGTKVLTEGYTQGVTIEGINDNAPLILSKNGAPEIFNDYENNEAVSPYSHAEGYSTHAGDYTSVSGVQVKQYLENTTNDPTDIDSGPDTSDLKGFAAHSEGAKTCAENDFSHAEGLASKAIGIGSHAEGVALFEESGITVSAVENNGRTLVVEENNYKNVLTPGDLICVKGCHVVVEKIYEEFVNVMSDEVVNNPETVPSDSVTPQSQKVYKIDLTYKLGEVLEDNETQEIYIVNFNTTTSANGMGSHAEGCSSNAVGNFSHAEGRSTIAEGPTSHSEGLGSTTLGTASHAEGVKTCAEGNASHSEGEQNVAKGPNSHAEGFSTVAEGRCAHSEGTSTSAYGSDSHTEGQGTIARGNQQHVQGKFNVEDTDNNYAHIVGNGSGVNNRSNAHTVDWQGNAWYSGNVEVPKDKDFVGTIEVEGNDGKTTEQTFSLIAELLAEIVARKQEDSNLHDKIAREKKDLIGSTDDDYTKNTIGAVKKKINDILTEWILNDDSTANPDAIDKLQELIDWVDQNKDGVPDILLSLVGVFERNQDNEVLGEKFNDYENNVATGEFSHAEGYNTTASGHSAHSEGNNTIAIGKASHSEGWFTNVDADDGHAEGHTTSVRAKHGHAEGYGTIVDSGAVSGHAEGEGSIASGVASHAEGIMTEAKGNYSHSEGDGTYAAKECQHVQGKYNKINDDPKYNYLHIIGNGSDDDNRSNAHTVDEYGNAWYKGRIFFGGDGQEGMGVGGEMPLDNAGFTLCRRVPAFYSGSVDPNTLAGGNFGMDGDIYIMFTEEETLG